VRRPVLQLHVVREEAHAKHCYNLAAHTAHSFSKFL
jgi:hypothetical protein